MKSFSILGSTIYAYVRKNWPFVFLTVFTGLIFILFSNWAYDDPFITYRYANNLRNGLGFVYNTDQRVLSTTTPLFTLLLTFANFFTESIPKTSILIGTISLSLGAFFLWKLADLRYHPIVGATLVFLFPSFPLLISTLGSEIPLYLALCLGSFTFYAKGNFNASAICLGFAVLTRPDGVLVSIPIIIHYLFNKKEFLLFKPILIVLGITLPWFIFSWIYFGSIFPVTLAAKQHQGLMEISQRFGPGIVTVFKPYFNSWVYLIETTLAVIGLLIIFWHERFWLIIITWNVLYFISYSIIGVTRYFWYYAPLVSGLMICVGYGINSSASIWKVIPKKSNIWAGIWTVLLIGLLTIYQYTNLWKMRSRGDTRAQIYRAVGEWLEIYTPEDAVVGALEVGIIGYYSHRQMLDFAGLLQPDISLQLKPGATYEDSAIWATAHYEPDYIVLQGDIFLNLQGDYIKRFCTADKTFAGVEYGYRSDIIIYSCQQIVVDSHTEKDG